MEIYPRRGLFILTSLSSVLCLASSVALAQTLITSSGLNTQVSGPIAVGNQMQFNITGGTRPGGGTNLFHTFGNFSVPNNNIANFLNNSGLPTSNILGRVTGGNVSNIFGIIQTTGFGNANLFLMNPAGFLFGPNATLNVGGMVTFTSADYLRLTDGARFNAIPNAAADAVLSTAPVAAFGFLGSNPRAITVQGSQLTVAEDTGISLVGGNITVQGGTITAPSGQVSLVSVGRPSNGSVGGEVVIAESGQGTRYTPTGYRSLRTITLSQGSTVDVSSTDVIGNQQAAGSVTIRGGQFVMENSSIEAVTHNTTSVSGGNVEVTADHIALSNGSRIETIHGDFASSGNITFNGNRFFATDSVIDASGNFLDVARGGAITIQGLQGSDTYAHSISLINTEIAAHSIFSEGGPITLRGNNITLNHTRLESFSPEAQGGPITLVSRDSLNIQDSLFIANSFFGHAGTVDLRAGTNINLTSTIIDARGVVAGSIIMTAPIISLDGSTGAVGGTLSTSGTINTLVGGAISITGRNAVNLINGTVLMADFGGTVLINGGRRFTSQQSTISAQSNPSCVPPCSGNGGNIQVEANKVVLTDSKFNTSTPGGLQFVGGTVTVGAKNMTLTNSQILSTTTEGQGGTINITSPRFHLDATSVIDASSQSGIDGTVTINGVVQP